MTVGKCPLGKLTFGKRHLMKLHYFDLRHLAKLQKKMAASEQK
jgi:hypothetical protein